MTRCSMRFAITALLVVVVQGCGSTEKNAPLFGPGGSLERGGIGGGYSQCADHPAGTTANGAPITSTAGTLLPQGVQIRCADSTAFTVNGSQVDLVYVAYGTLQDCPAGCFSSEVCAIYDGTDVLLYSAAWFAANEKPVLPNSCPDAATGDSRQCTTPTPGSQHPVTQTPAFISFRDAQVQGGGPWRFCFF